MSFVNSASPSLIAKYPPATADAAQAHFAAKLSVETDCTDVYQAVMAMQQGRCAADFVLLDVRSAAAYQQGHAIGALSKPHREIEHDFLKSYPAGTIFVVYCAGPHCNGADQAAYNIARLGFAVKLMIGGFTGWLDEGLPIVAASITPGATASSHQDSDALRCGC